jgi:hypothetical protein
MRLVWEPLPPDGRVVDHELSFPVVRVKSAVVVPDAVKICGFDVGDCAVYPVRSKEVLA